MHVYNETQLTIREAAAVIAVAVEAVMRAMVGGDGDDNMVSE